MRPTSDAAPQILEAMMTSSEHEKTFIERIYDQGVAEGRARAKAEGKARAKAEAVLHGGLRGSSSRHRTPRRGDL
jgi:flagellar biosynthesis/type III secretory pathway protein FliH